MVEVKHEKNLSLSDLGQYNHPPPSPFPFLLFGINSSQIIKRMIETLLIFRLRVEMWEHRKR